MNNNSNSNSGSGGNSGNGDNNINAVLMTRVLAVKKRYRELAKKRSDAEKCAKEATEALKRLSHAMMEEFNMAKSWDDAVVNLSVVDKIEVAGELYEQLRRDSVNDGFSIKHLLGYTKAEFRVGSVSRNMMDLIESMHPDHILFFYYSDVWNSELGIVKRR